MRDEMVGCILSGMLTSMWVALCLSGVVLLLVHFLAPSPRRRYQLWLGVLSLTALVAIVPLPYQSPETKPATLAPAPRVDSEQNAPSTVAKALPDAKINEVLEEESRLDLRLGPTFTMGHSWGAAVVGTCLAGVVVGLALIAVQLVGTLRIKRRTRAPGNRFLEIWSNAVGPNPVRRVALVSSDSTALPAAIGYFRPVVVLPAWFSRALRSDEIRQLMLHEMAHVQRYDDWTLLAHRVLQMLCWWNPLAWAIGRMLDVERELACDEVVAGEAGARTYAQTLVHVAEVSRRWDLSLAPGVLRGNLTRRIESLLTARKENRPRKAYALLVVPVLALGVVLAPAVDTAAERIVSLSTAPSWNLQSIRADLDSTFRAYADSGFSGSILVAAGDSVILEMGYGLADRESGIPARADTRYSVAGFTKMFTAAAILVLEDQGALELTDSVARFFPVVTGRAAGVTVHQLLTHTDGMTRHNAPIYRRDRDGFVRAMAATPDSFPPGEGYRYNDFGHSLLAAIIEVVTGQSYESYIRERFLEPAGLSKTGFEDQGAVIAREYSGKRGQYPIPERAYVWGRRGSLGMVSTVADMYRWTRAMDDPRIIPARVRDRMHQTYGRTDWEAEQGYGWDLVVMRDGSRVWRRVAGTPGMEGELLYDEANGWTAVILVNSRIGWRFRVWDRVARSLNGRSPADE